MKRDLCESAKRGRKCCDDLCWGADITLCGFDQDEYDEMTRDYFAEEDFDDPEAGVQGVGK